MKVNSVLLGIIFLLVANISLGQKIENKKFNCYPKSPPVSIFKQIGSVKWEDFSNIGTSWSFLGTQKITMADGKVYIKGDLLSPNGGKMNIKENEWNKPLYILKKEWDCN